MLTSSAVMTCLRLFIAAMLVLTVGSVAQDKSKTTTTCLNNGYQLFAAEVTISGKGSAAGWEEHRVFMIDSASGRVWEYVPESLDKTGKFRSSGFLGVAPISPAP